MTKQHHKPIVRKYSQYEWEFIYPSSIDNEKVQEEYWEAVELLDYEDEKAERIFKSLISRYPFYIDAYNHLSLSFSNQNKDFESLITAEKSYKLGKECFPKEFNFNKDKLIWGNLDNRPFLRACQIYGLECQKNKNYSAAISVYKENLALNENDNQGIRYLLLESFFAFKEYGNARQLLNKYLEDYSIEFAFGSIALDILENNTSLIENKLTRANQINKFFVEEVTKVKHLKPPTFRLPGEPYFDAGIVNGSIQQSFDYWSRNKDLYKNRVIIDYFKTLSKNI